MTKTRRNEIVVGIFVIIGFAIMLGMTALIRGNTGINPYVLHARYENVAGLEIGSAVLVSGFRLGRVTSMQHIVTKEGRSVIEITMKIGKTIPIHKDAKAKLAQQGFLGDMRIEIDPGTRKAGDIESYTLLDSIPVADFGGIIEASSGIVVDGKEAITRVKDLLSDETRIAEFDRALRGFADATENLNRLIEENRSAVSNTMANLEQITTDGKQAVADAKSAIAEVRDRARTLGENVDSTLRSVESGVRDLEAQLRSMAEKAGAVIDENRDRVASLMQSARESSDSLRAILGDIREGKGTIGRLFTDDSPFRAIGDILGAVKGALGSGSDEWAGQPRYGPAPELPAGEP